MTYRQILVRDLEILDADLMEMLNATEELHTSQSMQAVKLIKEYKQKLRDMSQNFLNSIKEDITPEFERFEDIAINKTGELAQTLIKKNHDYGDSFHRTFQRHGMAVADIHISEKYDRFISLLTKEAKVEESIDDSLLDLAGYCILTLIERDKQQA